MTQRILIDTSVYVDWFRTRRHDDIVAGRRGPPSLSAVVAMELLAGRRRREGIEEWTERFRRSGRLVVPGWEAWRLTGRVLRLLRDTGVHESGMVNDVLIAMSARSAGMKVFTSNRGDFERIAAVEAFDLEVVA